MGICENCPYRNNPIGHCYEEYKEVRTVCGKQVVNTYYRPLVDKLGKLRSKRGNIFYSFDSEYKCKKLEQAIRHLLRLEGLGDGYPVFEYKTKDITDPEELKDVKTSPEEVLKQETEEEEFRKVEKIINNSNLTKRELEAFDFNSLSDLAIERGTSRQAIWKQKQKARVKLKKTLK